MAAQGSGDGAWGCGENAGAEGERQPWVQAPGEPSRWYARFQVYLDLGPMRTLAETARRAGQEGKGKAYVVNNDWTFYSRQFRWRERALAWDMHQRELLALSERNLRQTLHGRRVQTIEEYLETVRTVLDNAHMAAAEEPQARQWMPQMRQFLLGLLAAERLEFGREDYGAQDPDNGLAITADDLRAAQRTLEAQEWEAAQRAAAVRGTAVRGTAVRGTAVRGTGSEGDNATMQAEEGLGMLPEMGGDAESLRRLPSRLRRPAGRTLYVCAGAEKGLTLDLAALRAVRTATGLQFYRLLAPTRARFAAMLRRERSLRRPVGLLHMALHAAAEGVVFADGAADGAWLSEQLGGVRVLLLAACEGESVGEWLGVVPYVVTLSEEICHEDAALLTQHFWHNIGREMEPSQALEEALAVCPPTVGEYVVRHW